MHFSCTQCPSCLCAKAGSHLGQAGSLLRRYIERPFALAQMVNLEFTVQLTRTTLHCVWREPTQTPHRMITSFIRVYLVIRVTQCAGDSFCSAFITSEPLQSSKASVEGEVHSKPVLRQPRHSGGGALFQGGPTDRGVFGNVSLHSDVHCVCASVCVHLCSLVQNISRDDFHTPPKPKDKKKTRTRLKKSCFVGNNQTNQNKQ